MKEYFVFALILILFGPAKPFAIQTTVIDGIGNSLSESLKPFEKIGENYYLFVPDIKKTWLGAVNYCRTKNAHLTSIETEEEWQTLTSYIMSKGYNGDFWIGSNDIDTPFEFFWISSGQPIHYAKWGKGEPNNRNDNERCVNLSAGIKFLMNDMPCDFQANYVCKSNNPKTVSVTVW